MKSLWSWYIDRRDILLLCAGIAVLLATAHYAPGVSHTTEYHHYEASQIDHDDDGLSATATTDWTGREIPEIQELYCTDSVGLYSYECAAVPALDGLEVSITPDPVRTADEFAYDWEHATFLRFSHNETADGATVETEPVDAEIVFESLALEADRVSEDERTAIEEGHVTTDYRLSTNELLEYNGEYYVVVQTGTSEGSVFGTVLTATGYLIGAGVVVQGYRRAIDHEIELYPNQ